MSVAFVPSCTLDLDADGKVWPSTDGPLLLRAMLGLPESAFAAGVTTLTTQDAKHAAYRRYQVPAAANLLDFDGDALVNGLTDGLIALRYMRMFRTPETTPETTCSA